MIYGDSGKVFKGGGYEEIGGAGANYGGVGMGSGEDGVCVGIG